MEQIKIGKFISEMRKKKGLTQGQLADMLYVSSKTISKWETGKGLPEVSTLMPLCEAVGISINELLSGERLSEENYKKKAEENMMLLIKEKEKNQRKSISAFLEISDIYDRIGKREIIAETDYQPTIKTICEISECAMNNGLLELSKYLDYPDIAPFLKDLIRSSTSTEKLLSCDEIFDIYSAKIMLSDLSDTALVKHLIMLQGYMYILHGTPSDMIYEKLSISFSNFYSEYNSV